MAVSTIKATIQMRRGLEQDFDADQMTAGEWAVSTDKKYVRMCFAPGIVVRMATYEAFEQDMREIQTILATCQDIQKAIDAMAKLAEQHRDAAAQSTKESEDYSKLSKSYAIGTGGEVRENDDADSSKGYYEMSKRLAQGFNGIIPMGTITFADLSNLENQVPKYMFNIADAFISDSRFNDGGGIYYGPGNNVVFTFDKKWDVLAASSVTGIKGSAENQYRQGNVNITPQNIGLGNVPNVTTDDQTPAFTAAAERGNIASGEKLSVIFGKIQKFFADLKEVAFSGSYNDLSDQPEIPTKTSQLVNDSGFKTTDTTYSTMTGATASTAGKTGLVPAPAAGSHIKYFRGDGTYVATSTSLAGTVVGIPADQTAVKAVNDKVTTLNDSLAKTAICSGTTNGITYDISAYGKIVVFNVHAEAGSILEDIPNGSFYTLSTKVAIPEKYRVKTNLGVANETITNKVKFLLSTNSNGWYGFGWVYSNPIETTDSLRTQLIWIVD